MALTTCPECEREVSDRAIACPHCGYPIRGGYGYEYRSERQLFGLPLVHIISGNKIDPVTGRLRVAKGIIAIGPIAVGGLALGGFSVGIFSFGGLSLGLVATGGVAIGVLLALGGAAVGLVAIGGAAAGYYALGGGVLGVHAFGGNAQDPHMIEFFRNRFQHYSGGR